MADPLLAAPLDADGNGIYSLSDGVDPQDAVTVSQLQAAIAGSDYSLQDYEKTGSYVYVGYKATAGQWFIYRRTVATNARAYASGSSSYSTAWTGRAGLTYA